MSELTSKPVWSFDPQAYITTVRQTGGHPCGCPTLSMVTYHEERHGLEAAIEDIRLLPEFWQTGLEGHYRECPKRTV